MNAKTEQRPPIDIDACRRHLARSQVAQRQANLKLWNQARADADRIVEHIARAYRPDRIWQWGSVLVPEKFDGRSDIDIAVEGDFNAETWFRLLGEIWTMTDFPLDCVDLQRIEPEYADIIKMKGKVVHERCPGSDRGNL